jgi:hypothetical protein
MRPSLFEKILEDLFEANSYFEQKKDALGLVGFASHQKFASVLFTELRPISWIMTSQTRMAKSITLYNLKVFLTQ